MIKIDVSDPNLVHPCTVSILSKFTQFACRSHSLSQKCTCIYPAPKLLLLLLFLCSAEVRKDDRKAQFIHRREPQCSSVSLLHMSTVSDTHSGDHLHFKHINRGRGDKELPSVASAKHMFKYAEQAALRICAARAIMEKRVSDLILCQHQCNQERLKVRICVCSKNVLIVIH